MSAFNTLRWTKCKPCISVSFGLLVMLLAKSACLRLRLHSRYGPWFLSPPRCANLHQTSLGDLVYISSLKICAIWGEMYGILLNKVFKKYERSVEIYYLLIY
ncbi:hypothetical protein AOLI_G00114820 [Acnodon oligacanthus]